MIFGVPPGVHLGGYLGGYIKFGKNVRIGHNVQIITRNHTIDNPDYPDERKEVVIGDYCWIGANAVILPGVHLGPHTIVAAGAVVTKSFPEGHCIIAGVPARKIKGIE
ncbi:MAG: acyltransferase [Thermoplasmata archaeon]|nr:acyltransferase [Thermoplasmata archaeon]